MSTYTRRRHSPKGQHDERHVDFNTQAPHGVPGRRADEVDQPFPNKPVSHIRPLNPRTQDSLDLRDFEKLTITRQSKDALSHQDHPSNGIKQTTASQHPKNDSYRLPRGELQMAKAIHAKQLMLQEKLRRVEEKIRQNIQRDGAGAAAGETNTRQSGHQRREPARGSEMKIQDRRQEGVGQIRKRQDQRNEDRLRNTHEDENLQRKGYEGTHEITTHGQEVSREPKKLRWETLKKPTRKGGDDKYSGIWGETKVKLADRAEKAKEREQTSRSDKGWTREEKCGDRTYKEMYSSDDEQAQRSASENNRGAARKLSGEPLLPSVSSPSQSSRPEQGGFGLTDSTDTSLQLLPCRICNRKFASERLETHAQICKKVKQSHRQAFNSYVNRTKGSAIEEYWKTHSRPKSPKVLKKKTFK